MLIQDDEIEHMERKSTEGQITGKNRETYRKNEELSRQKVHIKQKSRQKVSVCCFGSFVPLMPRPLHLFGKRFPFLFLFSC
jgi:hypothetical protein